MRVVDDNRDMDGFWVLHRTPESTIAFRRQCTASGTNPPKAKYLTPANAKSGKIGATKLIPFTRSKPNGLYTSGETKRSGVEFQIDMKKGSWPVKAWGGDGAVNIPAPGSGGFARVSDERLRRAVRILAQLRLDVRRDHRLARKLQFLPVAGPGEYRYEIIDTAAALESFLRRVVIECTGPKYAEYISTAAAEGGEVTAQLRFIVIYDDASCDCRRGLPGPIMDWIGAIWTKDGSGNITGVSILKKEGETSG